MQQLKQYQCDFEEERKAREEMSKIMHHLEARDKDCVDQIAQLRKHVNELSTEKNDLAFQLDQLRQEQQVCVCGGGGGGVLFCVCVCVSNILSPFPYSSSDSLRFSQYFTLCHTQIL